MYRKNILLKSAWVLFVTICITIGLLTIRIDQNVIIPELLVLDSFISLFNIESAWLGIILKIVLFILINCLPHFLALKENVICKSMSFLISLSLLVTNLIFTILSINVLRMIFVLLKAGILYLSLLSVRSYHETDIVAPSIKTNSQSFLC